MSTAAGNRRAAIPAASIALVAVDAALVSGQS